jgi:hypothetical protein
MQIYYGFFKTVQNCESGILNEEDSYTYIEFKLLDHQV